MREGLLVELRPIPPWDRHRSMFWYMLRNVNVCNTDTESMPLAPLVPIPVLVPAPLMVLITTMLRDK